MYFNVPIQRVSQEHIDAQHARFLEIVRSTFKGDRLTALEDMYRDLHVRLVTAPASSKSFYHNAYEGGYLDHVLNVIETAQMMTKVYRHRGGLIDFTDEELIFVAMHHDLGKLGDNEGPMYEAETDQKWISKGYVYKSWGDGQQFITTTDRTLYLLQLHGVKMNKHEYLAIKLTDGLYDENNARYLKNDRVFPHTTSLFYIVHWADHMAAMVEQDQVRAAFQGKTL